MRSIGDVWTPFCTVPLFTVPFCTVPFCTVPFCTHIPKMYALYIIILSYVVLSCLVLSYLILSYILSYRIFYHIHVVRKPRTPRSNWTHICRKKTTKPWMPSAHVSESLHTPFIAHHLNISLAVDLHLVFIAFVNELFHFQMGFTSGHFWSISWTFGNALVDLSTVGYPKCYGPFALLLPACKQARGITN